VKIWRILDRDELPGTAALRMAIGGDG
jgi:hypothetical protein